MLDPLIEKPDTLTDLIYERIRSAIALGGIAPGERITESEIAKQLSVSKTPVREALLRLREIGLVEPNGRRGLRVIESTPAAVAEAYEIRAVLEIHTAGGAARRASGAERRAIVEAAAATGHAASAGDVAGFGAADRAFHRLIAQVAGNPRIQKAIFDAITLAHALRVRRDPTPDAATTAADAHRRIAAAIDRRDAGAAQREMADHLMMVNRYVAEDPGLLGDEVAAHLRARLAGEV